MEINSYFGNSILGQVFKHFHIFNIILSSQSIHLPQPEKVYTYVCWGHKNDLSIKLSFSLCIFLPILVSIQVSV